MAYDTRSSLDLYSRNAKELMDPQEQELYRNMFAALHGYNRPDHFQAECNSAGGTVGQSVDHELNNLDTGSQTYGPLEDGSTALMLIHPSSSANPDVDQARNNLDTDGGTRSQSSQYNSKDSEGSHLHFKQAVDTKTVKLRSWQQKIKCPYCDLVPVRKTLPRHIQQKHSGPQTRLYCAICPKTFVRLDIKVRHEREQHGCLAGDAGTIECVRCGKRIRDRTLKEHFRSRKCIGAPRTRAESRTEGDILRDLAFFGVETMVDATLVASDLLVKASVFGAWYNYWKDRLGGSAFDFPHVWDQMQIAIRILSRKLRIASPRHALYLVYTMLGAHSLVFGVGSRKWHFHVKYMQNILRHLNLDFDRKQRLLDTIKDSCRNRFHQRRHETARLCVLGHDPHVYPY